MSGGPLLDGYVLKRTVTSIFPIFLFFFLLLLIVYRKQDGYNSIQETYQNKGRKTIPLLFRVPLVLKGLSNLLYSSQGRKVMFAISK